MEKMTLITIPAGMTYADLKMSRDPETGDVEFDTSVIERIEAASGLPVGFFMSQHEDVLATLLTSWYRQHLDLGGDIDPVQEDLIAEVKIEDKAGQVFSFAPGRA